MRVPDPGFAHNSAVHYIPPLQVIWLVVYWGGVLPVLYLLGIAFLNGTPQQVVTLMLALAASVMGAVWATKIARSHVDSALFVKGTTVVRSTAVAWLGVQVYIFGGAVADVVLGTTFSEDGTALGFISTVGAISLLAAIGPGYGEYREARSAAGSGPRHEPAQPPVVD